MCSSGCSSHSSSRQQKSCARGRLLAALKEFNFSSWQCVAVKRRPLACKRARSQHRTTLQSAVTKPNEQSASCGSTLSVGRSLVCMSKCRSQNDNQRALLLLRLRVELSCCFTELRRRQRRCKAAMQRSRRGARRRVFRPSDSMKLEQNRITHSPLRDE